MKVSKEELTHFECEYCHKWWSIGDFESPEDGYRIFCPYCGKANKLEAQKEPPKSERWRAELEQEYFGFTDGGNLFESSEQNDDIDDFRYSTGNYFKTKEEAEAYKKNLLNKQKLKDIALRLNAGVEIDWNDREQKKYTFCFRHIDPKAEQGKGLQVCGAVYCLSEKFLDVALEEIGEQELIELIKSGI